MSVLKYDRAYVERIQQLIFDFHHTSDPQLKLQLERQIEEVTRAR